MIGKSILQCYLMDCEMFVGEQRFVEKFIKELMNWYNDKEEAKKILQSYAPVKGFKAERIKRKKEKESAKNPAIVNTDSSNDNDEDNDDDDDDLALNPIKKRLF